VPPPAKGSRQAGAPRGETIPARVVDVPSILDAEHAENLISKEFTPTARLAISDALEAEIGAQAEARKGTCTDPAQGIVQDFAQGFGQKTRQAAAVLAGFGNHENYCPASRLKRGAENFLEHPFFMTLSVNIFSMS
jgi:hypothetical protein